MDWYLSEATMAAMVGEGWRGELEPRLDLARILHIGRDNDVHPLTLTNGRVAWCAMVSADKATCFGVEDAPRLVIPSDSAMPRKAFFGSVPYGTRDGWTDARSRSVVRAAKNMEAPPVEPGSWVVLCQPMDVESANPHARTAYVARVVEAEGGEARTVQMAAGRQPVELVEAYPGWDVRDFSKYAAAAGRMWNEGKDWFTFQFAAKVAGAYLWRDAGGGKKPKAAQPAKSKS